MTLAAGGLLGLPLAWEQMYLWATHLVAIPDGGRVLLETPTCQSTIFQNAPNRIGMKRLSGLLVLLLLYGMLVLVLVLLMLCALACDIGCWWVAWATPGLTINVFMGDTSDCNS